MRKNVFIISHDAAIKDEIKTHLSEMGFKSSLFSIGEEALSEAEHSKPDLVITSYDCYNSSADAFIEKIKYTNGDEIVPVLLIADTAKETFQHFIKSGADDYLITPIRKQELIMRVQSLLWRSQKDLHLMGTVKALEEEKMLILSEMRAQREAAKELLISELLYDKITGFPTTPTLLKDIRAILESSRTLDIIYFCISKLKKVEEVFGWQVIDLVLEFIAKRLEELAQQTLTEQDILAIDRAAGDDFILFISSPENYYRNKNMPLSVFGEKILGDLKQSILDRFGSEIAFQFEFYLGVSTISYNAKIRMERLVYNAIRDAISSAISEEQRSFNQNVEKLQALIDRGDITTLFQPIIDLQTFEIIGYEAISRGVDQDFHRQPELLFDLADRADVVWQLERVCRKHALDSAKKLPPRTLLFLNLDPNAANDPDLKGTDLVFNSAIPPARIVFEITERSNISDYPRFKKYINQLKEIGFHCAIDDAGSGYASLQSITEIDPDFIKFDMALVRDIHTAFIKQSLVEVLVRFAKKMNIPIIAEGVESLEEYTTLVQLGVTLGQGFLFSKPLPTFAECKNSIHNFQESIKKHDKT